MTPGHVTKRGRIVEVKVTESCAWTLPFPWSWSVTREPVVLDESVMVFSVTIYDY